jgi:hypothetical protein
MPTIPQGYDLFETIPGDSHFPFPNAFPIPAEFFGKGSAPFIGRIRFAGVPIREFTDPRTKKTHKTGTTDTIVHRKQEVTIKAIPGSGTTEIELVRLSVRSCSPIEVQVGDHVERWDVHVSLSRSKPSTGSMTITQTSDQGGHFASTLAVFPLFRFERIADGEERHLDIGALQVSEAKQKLFAHINTLEESDVAWGVSAAQRENTLNLSELAGRFAVSRAIWCGPHPVLPALRF